MERLFGTDGVRGRYGEGWLTVERVSALGRALATVLPRPTGRAPRALLLSEAGGGIVVVGDEDVGVWKRVVTAASVRVAVSGDTPLDTSDQDAIGDAAAAFAAFLERPLDLTFG